MTTSLPYAAPVEPPAPPLPRDAARPARVMVLAPAAGLAVRIGALLPAF